MFEYQELYHTIDQDQMPNVNPFHLYYLYENNWIGADQEFVQDDWIYMIKKDQYGLRAEAQNINTKEVVEWFGDLDDFNWHM